MQAVREIWRRITKSRYARALEGEVSRQRAEIDRLRAENRALLNSILGIAGIPPIPAAMPAESFVAHASQSMPEGAHMQSPPRPDKPESSAPSSGAPTDARFESQPQAPGRAALGAHGRFPRGPFPSSPSPRRSSQAALPLRRRSWQQINRMLELESAKKKPQET